MRPIDPCLMGEVAASPGTRPTASSLGGVSSWSTALSADAGLEFIKVFLFWSGPTEARGDNPVKCQGIMFVYQSHLILRSSSPISEPDFVLENLAFG